MQILDQIGLPTVHLMQLFDGKDAQRFLSQPIRMCQWSSCTMVPHGMSPLTNHPNPLNTLPPQSQRQAFTLWSS
jgi:hypothetical protein